MMNGHVDNNNRCFFFRMQALLVRLYARKDGQMDFEAFVSAVTTVLIVDKLQGANLTRMLGNPLFTEVRFEVQASNFLSVAVALKKTVDTLYKPA